MPSGRTHDRITWLSAPLIVAGAWALGAGWSSLWSVGAAYLFGGLMFGGDLDIHSVQYRRWGWLRWIWLPYRRLVSHRSIWSHGLFVGTIVRLAYLGTIAALVGLLVLLGGGVWFGLRADLRTLTLYTWAIANRDPLLWMLVGLEAGAMSHSLSDWTGSGLKRLLRRRQPNYARRGQR